MYLLYPLCLLSRYRPRFFDQVGHQNTFEYIGNKHSFTKSCHHQTYQNYEQSPVRFQNSYFQSHFSASKINRIFLNFFSMKKILLGDQLLVMTFFENFDFKVPYAPHYNPRFVYFLPPFYIEERFILQTIYVLKTNILHFLSLKSAVYTRERLLIKRGLYWRA